MAYLPTIKILEELKARLDTLRTDAADAQSERLFQRVAYFGANRMAQAMQSVFASERRVAYLVPGGDTYTGRNDAALLVHSQRMTRVALLIADQAVDLDRDDALMGGVASVGILAMKDRIVDELMTTPFTVPGLAFVPAEGEPLVIEPTERKAGNIGRECWLQWLVAYAGSAKANIPL